MYLKIGKRYSFDAAHQLPGHRGKCANLHGHTYSVFVWVYGDQILSSSSSEGMVMDYADLDEIVKPIIAEMDHSFLMGKIEPDDGESAARTMWGAETKIYRVGLRTTAENLAAHIAHRIHPDIEDYDNVYQLGVVVSETPNTEAEVVIPVNNPHALVGREQALELVAGVKAST